MKILITGGCGFIGSNLAVFLKNKNKNFEINTLDNFFRSGSKFNLVRLKNNAIKNYNYDIKETKFLKKLPKYDLIIHCAAEPAIEVSKKNLTEVFHINLVGTLNVLQKCVSDKSKLIFLSSSRVYSINELTKLRRKKTHINEQFSTGYPNSIYGFSKKSSEELIKEYSYLYEIKYIINRLAVISGPWQFGKQEQGFVSLWVWRHLNNKKLNYIGFGGRGQQTRDVMHIKDFCELINIQIKKINKINNIILNVGGGPKNVISLKKLTKMCETETNRSVPIGSIKKTSIYDIPYFITDLNKVQKTYKWRPKLNVRQIINDIYKWMILYRKNLKKYF